jgi:hypothetical protein
MASGRPVIAYGAGGALETVIKGETGLFFDQPTPESLMDALCRLDRLDISPARLRAHAETFDVRAFKERMRTLVFARHAEHQEVYTSCRPSWREIGEMALSSGTPQLSLPMPSPVTAGSEISHVH